MKKLLVVFFAAFFVFAAVSPVFAGGDKNQKEIGAGTAPGPGGDAQGNQAG